MLRKAIAAVINAAFVTAGVVAFFRKKAYAVASGAIRILSVMG
jgi:hypothetical protein